MYVFGNGPNKNTHMYSVPQIVLLRDCLFHELEAVPKPERYNGRYFSLIHPPTHSEKEITPPPASGKRLASELSAVGAQMQHRRPLFLGGCYFWGGVISLKPPTHPLEITPVISFRLGTVSYLQTIFNYFTVNIRIGIVSEQKKGPFLNKYIDRLGV